MSSFKIVRIKRRVLALFSISGYRVILLCLKTKKQFKHFFSRNSDVYREYTWGVSRYLGHGFILSNDRYFKDKVNLNDTYKLFHMASVNNFEQVAFPKLNQSFCPVQVYKKAFFIFKKKFVLYGLNLRTKKTGIIDPEFRGYVKNLATSEKLDRLYKFNQSMTATSINILSGKVILKKKVDIPRPCRRSFYFSSDSNFLIIRGVNKTYHLFSTVHGFQKIRTLRCNFESNFLCFEKRSIYVTHLTRKQAACFDLLSIRRSLRKGNLERLEKRDEALGNLRKRTHLVFRKMTESVHSDGMRFDLKVERPRVLFEGKKLGRIEKKANQLSARLFDLEESVKRETLKEEVCRLYRSQHQLS